MSNANWGSKKARRLTIQDLLDFVEEHNVSLNTPLHVSYVTQHDYEGDWRGGSDVSEVRYYGTDLDVRGSCRVCG